LNIFYSNPFKKRKNKKTVQYTVEVISMKQKAILTVVVGSIAVIGVTLFLVFSNSSKNVEETNENTSVEQTVEKNETEEVVESDISEEVVEEEETTISNDEENKEISDEISHEQEEHDDHDGHDHTNATADEYKSEDIISNYFAAITLGDTKTLNQLFPTGKTENEQLAILLQSSSVVADIVDMEKQSLKNNTAEYTVVVKLHTRESDENFTDNKTTYKLVLDLSSGVITSKTTVNTEYLE